jgi:hypothetical protein
VLSKKILEIDENTVRYSGKGRMKPIVAGVLTVLILATMLLLGSRGTGPAPAVSSDPKADLGPGAVRVSAAEQAVHELLRCGEGGDVAGYLAAFAEPLKTRLEREVDERGRSAFADDLKRAAGARKSHAVFAAEPDGDAIARVAVETIYPDRNERQVYRVEKTASGWRIADVSTVRSHQPAAKFGTPASYIAPEGVPVQAPPGGGLTVETDDDPDPP